MRNVFIIIQHEFVTMLRKRSFWLTTFLLPAVIMGLSLGSQALAGSALASDGSNPLFASFAERDKPAGYIDAAGLIKRIPDRLPKNVDWKLVKLRAYPDEAAAQAALEAGQIDRYYVVPADFIQTGDLTVIDKHFSALNGLESNDYFRYVVRLNLTDDADLAVLLDDPTANVTTRALAPQAKPSTGLASFAVPFGTLLIFYFVITMTSGFMLQSVTKEKENRTIEVLLLSVRPRDLMLGKVLGLGGIALLQAAIWGGGGWLLMSGGQLGEAARLPGSFVLWALLYFLLGYLLYASVLGAIGALAPSLREGAQFTFLVMFPLFIPLVLNTVLIESPNGAISILLSLFPLTAPVAMITRLATVPVPIEQLLLGLALLAITTYGVIVLASRFFRADTLLAFQNISLRRIVQELRR